MVLNGCDKLSALRWNRSHNAALERVLYYPDIPIVFNDDDDDHGGRGDE